MIEAYSACLENWIYWWLEQSRCGVDGNGKFLDVSFKMYLRETDFKDKYLMLCKINI